MLRFLSTFSRLVAAALRNVQGSFVIKRVCTSPGLEGLRFGLKLAFLELSGGASQLDAPVKWAALCTYVHHPTLLARHILEGREDRDLRRGPFSLQDVVQLTHLDVLDIVGLWPLLISN